MLVETGSCLAGTINNYGYAAWFTTVFFCDIILSYIILSLDSERL